MKLTPPTFDPDNIFPPLESGEVNDLPVHGIENLIDWETFKEDVGLKHMILEIDIAILLR